ncbi:4-hydroxybenzoate octaprenyltransferase [Alphaproteobacteria bacterium]|nr:4-hydroxybenzoate octaprenyltransferase [Alphaproteobacteria bacterium]
MLDKIVPKKIKHLIDLIRLDKPIGFLLLMWPCFMALANLPQSNVKLIYWYIYFIAGAFLMRSAGCIINDLVDIKLDKNVKRTAERPLASKKVSVTEAITLLLVLLLLSLSILLQFSFYVIIIGLVSIPLVLLYPFLKRYTYWPQLGLGLLFNWGVLIVSVQFNGTISFSFFLLYIACVFWTLAYDTIYAYQDREDDIKNNIKSTAVLFGNNGYKYVRVFYSVFYIIIGFLGFYSSKSFLSLVVIIALIFVMSLHLKKWKFDSTNSSNHYFKFNNIIGLLCFLYLVIF